MYNNTRADILEQTYINMFIRNERDQEIKDRALRILRIKKAKTNL